MTDNRFDHLKLEQVTRRFGGRAALEALDLTISGGGVVALLGPSGCGKSTALNCLAGLLPLSGGSIWLDQKRIDTLPPAKRGFGMVFQNYALFPHMSVRRNVGFGLRMRGVGRDDTRRRVDEALRLVQLQQLGDRLPGQLSGGQQQRVAIARAIVLEPPLVLMDEPLSNLDASLRLEMRTEIRRLHQSLGLTTIYVTHDQEEALSLADRLVILREGVVQQVGSPEELYRAPVNAYVASFMGYRNLLPVQVTGRDGDLVRVNAPGLDLTGTPREDLGDGDAVIAIRPEDFAVGGTGDNLLEVEVEVVEYHGREQAVQGRLKGGQVIRLRSTDRLAPGDAVTVHVPADKLLVFAADADALAAAAAAAGGQATPPGADAATVTPSGVPDGLDGPPAGVVAGPPAGAADARAGS